MRNFEIRVASSMDMNGALVDPVTCTMYEAYVNQGLPTTFECDIPRNGRYVMLRSIDAQSQLTICNIDVHGTAIGKILQLLCVSLSRYYVSYSLNA